MNLYGPHKELLQAIQGVKVLVAGDLIVDETWTVERFDGQDGDSKLRVVKKDVTPGGAGLVAELLYHLGCKPTLLTYAGSCGVMVPHEAQWKLINGCGDNQRVIRTQFDREHPLDRFDFPAEGFPYPQDLPPSEWFDQFDSYVFSDYGKGFLASPPRLTEAQINKLTIDTKMSDDWLSYGGLLKCSDRHGQAEVMTLGREGIKLGGEEYWRQPYDGPLPTWGCGDAVTAVLGAILGQEQWEADNILCSDVAWLANDFAYLRIFKQSPTALDVDYLSSKERTVLTSGAFDLCHPGHVKLLEEAADVANERHAHLVVGVNTHESVVAYKGVEPSLPIFARKAFVKSILEPRLRAGGFDVVNLPEPDPCALANEWNARTIIKGGDWEGKSVPEAEGRELVLVPRDDNWASRLMREAVVG